MYTLKIVLYNDKTIYREAKDVEWESLSVEGQEEIMKLISKDPMELMNGKSADGSTDPEVREALYIRYTDAEDESMTLILFLNVIVYIMQNGKTIDVLRV